MTLVAKSPYSTSKTQTPNTTLTPLSEILAILLRQHEKRTTNTMTKFRPCIDLHAGSVKQIVGGTLTTTTSELKTNFTSELPSSYYANLYKENALEGAHVIMLGPGNENACREACEAWPGHLQVGGGIKDENAKEWIEKGASKVSLL
jgi:phosphoribosylformimino-5-aminoimidazole carboxamide ribotide isomerase